MVSKMNTLTRRSFLGAAATLAAATACSAPAAPTGGGSLGPLVYQLGWIRNVQFAGEYMADRRGHFAAGGFDGVDLVPGGPNVSPNTVVVSGRALLTLSGCDVTGPAILQGAPLVALGAVRQTNPLCIMSLSSAPIREPRDLIGRRIGLQATNETTWQAFLQVNGIDPAQVPTVPAQFDPQPLAAGEVDGWFSFYANEPNSLRVRGYDVTTMLLADHGFPLVSDIIVARRDSLTTNRAAVAAAVRAEIQGWQDALRDREAATILTVDEYGRDLGLDRTEQRRALDDHATLILTEDTRANGLFTISEELRDRSMESLHRGGIAIAADQLFDMSVLDEVYAADPALRTAA